MTRKLTTAALALTTIIAASHAASAQVVAYHHRSTVWGDHLAGASELVRAEGAYLRDEADSAETWVRAVAAHDDLMYRRAEHRLQLKRMYDEYIIDKANERRERDAAKENAEQAAAVQLWQAAQRGIVMWPAALRRAEYANSLTLIESILRTWSPTNPTADAYRRALSTEAGVLATRIAGNKQIDFLSRVAAVRTLSRIQRLAAMPGVDGAAEQVAMR